MRTALTVADRQARAHRWLREQVLRQREDTALNPRRIDRGRAVGPFTVDIAFWYPQPYLANLGMLIRPRERRAELGRRDRGAFGAHRVDSC